MTTESKPVVYATSLESAKEGETVMLRYGGWSNHKEPRVITRTTPTIIFIGGRGFNREGREKGTHRPDWIKLTNDQDIQDLADEKERLDLAHLLQESRPWNSMTLDQLRQVSTLVQSFAKQEQPVEV